jgi:hypothetical protein
VSPFIWDMPTYEVVNRLNDRDLAAAYGDLLAGFARSGILDREPLRRLGAALDAPYVLQPGVAEFSQVVGDKFEVVGWKLLKTRLTTLRLWLQLWDTRTGQLLWEGSGEVTVAAQLLTQEASVSLEDIAQRLCRAWSTTISCAGQRARDFCSRTEHQAVRRRGGGGSRDSGRAVAGGGSRIQTRLDIVLEDANGLRGDRRLAGK